MSATNGFLAGYHKRGWRTVPVHRPDPDTGGCSCGKPDCPSVGKHPDGRFWPGGSDAPGDFENRNIGVQLGPDSRNLADVDLDCGEAVVVAARLLPATGCAFGRGGQLTHALFTVADAAAGFARLRDPVLAGDEATIVELRWPTWDEAGKQFKAFMTVFPPSLHVSGETVEWVRDGEPAGVAGAELGAAVRHVAAAVLVARYARPAERHALVLLLANLLVRAGWADDAKVVGFVAAVFAARNDADKVQKVVDGEGLGAVRDARKRFRDGKPMTGLSALKEMLDPAIDAATVDKVIGRVKEWLGIPDSPGPKVTTGTGSGGGKPTAASRSPAAEIPPYIPFPTHLLPPVVRAYVEATAAAMNCDPSYSALPALAALGAAIGSSHVASPKKGWKEPPYVWALPIGKSGSVKSPPYRDVEDMAEDINDRLEAEYEAEAADAEAKLHRWSEAKKAGEDPGPRPTPPVLKSFMKGDVTIEALVGDLQDNPRGLFIGQDELTAWISGFVKYSGKTGASDLSRWLQLHNAGSINYTRKTGDRRRVRIRGVGVSVAGTIQPKILSRVLNEEFRASGFLARLLLALPPWRRRQWTEAEVDDAIRSEFGTLLRVLYALPRGAWPDDRPCPHLVRLTDEAKARFVAFYNANGEDLATADEDMSAAMSKLEGYALRFALIFHCCRLRESAGGERLGAEDMAAAIELTRWFRDEAERVYLALGETVEQQAARHLFDTVSRLAEARGGRISVREFVRSKHKKYPTTQAAEAALQSLVEAGFGTWGEGTSSTAGGHRVRWFTPRSTVDTRPDGGGDEWGPGGVEVDTRPTGDSPAPPDQYADRGASHSSSIACGGDARDNSDSLDRVSTVDPTGGRPEGGLGASVTRKVECRPTTRKVFFENASGSVGVARVTGAVAGWSGPIGLDTETTGLDPARDRVRLLQLAVGDDVVIIDVFAFADPAAALAPLFAALAEKEVVGHNLQFDLRMLAPLGFTPGRVFDTMLASRVLHAGRRGGNNARLGHGLGDVVARELGRPLDKSGQRSNWAGTLTPAQLAYAAADAAVLVPLAETLRARITAAELTATATLEMRVLPGVTWASPVCVDAAAWLTLARDAGGRQRHLAEEMDRLAPNGACLPGAESRNWNSTSDIRTAFADLGIAIDSTDDAALAAVDHPLAGLLREYRSVTKRAGTYGRAWLAGHLGSDGRVRASWNQLGAESGRMSCSDPNLQQIPRSSDYRRCVTAPPGHLLVKADYSQVELRIAARVAGEKVMVEAYRNGGDLHRLTAARVLGKPEGEVTGADRQVAKSLNFGLLYGMGWRGLRGYARANYGVDLTDEQARGYRNAFFRAYPGLASWHRWVRGELDRLFRADPAGTVEVRTLGGRRRVLPVTKRLEGGAAYPNVTEALNTPVQGSGADGLKAAIAGLWERRSECPGAVPVIFCHDEIVVQVPEAAAARAAEWLRRCMVDAVAPLIDPVPVGVDVTVGRTWGG